MKALMSCMYKLNINLYTSLFAGCLLLRTYSHKPRMARTKRYLPSPTMGSNDFLFLDIIRMDSWTKEILAPLLKFSPRHHWKKAASSSQSMRKQVAKHRLCPPHKVDKEQPWMWILCQLLPVTLWKTPGTAPATQSEQSLPQGPFWLICLLNSS